MTAAVLALSLAPRGAFAQELSTGTVPLEAVLAAARRDNPEIKAARQAWAAAQEGPAQAGAFDDPSLVYSRMIADVETKAGPMKDKVSAAQKIPFWGKRGLAGRAASADAEVARQSYRAKLLEVSARTTRAYCELYFLDRTLSILREQASVLERFARVADKKYAVGRAPQAMVFRAQVELATLGNELVTAEHERASARARLNALLNRMPRQALGALQRPSAPDFRWDTEELTRRALEGRPELMALAALQDRRDAQRRLALRRYFPDFMLGYEYTRIGNGTTELAYDGRDAHAVMVGLSIPLWLGKERAATRQAEAALAAARLSAEDLANRTRYQVEDLSVRADAAARLFKLYEDTVLPQAQAALEATQSAYEGDRAGFLDLLDAQRALLRLELEHERHRADFWAEVADLARVVGAPLAGGDP